MEFFNESSNATYNCSTNINFYKTYPNCTTSLEKISSVAIERLKVLRVFEEVSAKTSIKSRAEFIKQLEKSMTNKQITNWRCLVYGVENSNDVSKMEKEREKDVISHFILRLAFSKSEQLRRWFITNELELFRVRLYAISMDSASFNNFLNSNDVGYPFIDLNNGNFDSIASEDVRNSFFGSSSRIYMVPFADAADLVGKRSVIVKDGIAYLTQFQLIPTICSRFRTSLSQSLAALSHSLFNLHDEDERILPILDQLCMDSVESCDFSPNITSIKAAQIDQIYRKKFPLCMRILHETLRQRHHLRHWGRMQYGLFLKSIGVPLEESLKFWKDEFTKIMESDKFDKTYSYNIRHNYGQEGRRTDYTPYSCMRIISSLGPSTGECHGCPFRHYDLDSLQNELQKRKISEDKISNIVDKVKQQHYQIACGMMFSAEKGLEELDFVPTQPGEYFKHCVDIVENK